MGYHVIAKEIDRLKTIPAVVSSNPCQIATHSTNEPSSCILKAPFDHSLAVFSPSWPASTTSTHRRRIRQPLAPSPLTQRRHRRSPISPIPLKPTSYSSHHPPSSMAASSSSTAYIPKPTIPPQASPVHGVVRRRPKRSLPRPHPVAPPHPRRTCTSLAPIHRARRQDCHTQDITHHKPSIRERLGCLHRTANSGCLLKPSHGVQLIWIRRHAGATIANDDGA